MSGTRCITNNASSQADVSSTVTIQAPLVANRYGSCSELGREPDTCFGEVFSQAGTYPMTMEINTTSRLTTKSLGYDSKSDSDFTPLSACPHKSGNLGLPAGFDHKQQYVDRQPNTSSGRIVCVACRLDGWKARSADQTCLWATTATALDHLPYRLASRALYSSFCRVASTGTHGEAGLTDMKWLQRLPPAQGGLKTISGAVQS